MKAWGLRFLVLVMLLSACSSAKHAQVEGFETSRSAPSVLSVREHDFALSTDQRSLAVGAINVAVTNEGPSTHELLAFRTDLAVDGLPLGPDGRVQEDGPRMTKVLDTQTDLAPGTQRTLTTTLAPGRYVLICNLENHYRRGMRTVINIT